MVSYIRELNSLDAVYFYNFEVYLPASHSTVVNIDIVFEKRFRSPECSYNIQRIYAYLLLNMHKVRSKNVIRQKPLMYQK